MTGVPSRETVLQTAQWLESFWRAREDTSFDPYDGLESERLSWLGSLPRPVQLAAVQLNKRSPVNLRRLAGVRPTRNSYSAAHFASACAVMAPLVNPAQASDLASALAGRLDWLCDTRVAGAWAYPFDVQTKTFAYKKTVPNVICTAFAVTALLDGIAFSALPREAAASRAQSATTCDASLMTDAALTADTPERAAERWAGAVRRAVSFTLEHLLSRQGDRVYFRYLEAEPLLIHNANLLAARYLARAGVAFGEDSWVQIAAEALPATLAAITDEGLLPYGEGSHEAWVDGHHTGFVAEALADLAGLLDAPGLDEAAASVLSSYRRALFEPDGRPLLYPGHRFPIDVITGAQGIQTFAKAGTEADVTFGGRVGGFMLSHMRTSTGTFLYRKGRLHVKAVPYVRWSDAPMCLSLAYLAQAMSTAGQGPPARPLASPSNDSVTA